MTSIRRCAPGFLGLAVLSVAGTIRAPAAEAAPDAAAAHAARIKWEEAVGAVPRELLKRDLLTWSDQLAAGLEKADAAGLIVSLEVFLRAGQPGRIAAVIPRLAREPGLAASGHDVARRLVERRHFELAQAWLEACPADADLEAVQSLVNWMDEENRRKPAYADLRDRTEIYLRGMYLRQKAGGPYSTDDACWAAAYWQRLHRNRKLEAHVAALERSVRASPADAAGVFEYLAARQHLPEDKQPSAGWLAEVCRLERALDNYVLARRFGWDKQPEAVIAFGDRSLACPVVDYDRTEFNRASMCSMYVPPEDVEKILRQWTKAALAGACFQAKKLDRAQQLVEELTGRKDGTMADLGPFLLAGQVQAASGQRVVEGRILKAEEERKDSARYWLDRAGYYLGRKEDDKVEEAYRAAMKLPADAGRFEVVRDYGWFLAGRNRQREAERLFRDEIARTGDENASFWLNQLKNLDGKGGVRFGWDEPLVWDWLTKRRAAGFGQAEQWQLEEAARKAADAPGAWPDFEKRARALAAEPCPPALQYCLGRILRGRGQAAEGVRMMATAWERWPKDAYPPADHVGDELLRALLEQADAKRAEAVLGRLLDESCRGQDPRWLGEVAVQAARAKAADLALRVWKRKLALDLTDREGLAELAGAGLAAQLRELYAGLARRAPDNGAVAEALKTLEGR